LLIVYCRRAFFAFTTYALASRLPRPHQTNIIVRNPNITRSALAAQLVADGHIIKDSTIYTVRADTRATIREMIALGWQPPLPISALPPAEAAD
jgi:hypothetical protein